MHNLLSKWNIFESGRVLITKWGLWPYPGLSWADQVQGLPITQQGGRLGGAGAGTKTQVSPPLPTAPSPLGSPWSSASVHWRAWQPEALGSPVRSGACVQL